MVTTVQRSEIRYAEDEFGVTDWHGWLDVMDARRRREGQTPAPRPLGEDPSAPPVHARLNYARWLADCECKAAVQLFKGEPGRWFWCPACGNAGTGGQLRSVLWPADRDLIDRDKATLPHALANWNPGDD